MPDLQFEVAGIDSSIGGLSPSLHFKVRIINSESNQPIQAILLNAQIQLQPARRTYNANEKEKLTELFGPPESWGQSLRNRLWANSSAIVGAFRNVTETVFAVPCTYDLNVGTTKYITSLDGGELSLLFLFSGSVFYTTAEGRLQVAPISWNQECVYRMPAQAWRELMDRHFPNTAWVMLERNVFNRLCDYKRLHALPTWEQTIEQLLQNENTGRASVLSAQLAVETAEAV